MRERFPFNPETREFSDWITAGSGWVRGGFRSLGLGGYGLHWVDPVLYRR